MSRKFEVGDRVKVNCPTCPHHGEETEVTACGMKGWDSVTRKNYIGYEVDCVMFGHRAIFEAHELIPLDDGRELVSWASCAWKPTSVRV